MLLQKLARLLLPGAAPTLSVLALLLLGSPAQSPVAAQQATEGPTTPSVCAAKATATAQASEIAGTTEAATLSATQATTLELTPEVTSEATQEAEAPVHFISLMPTDIHFNPSLDKPVALVTVYSLIFENELSVPLHIEKPVFQLTINKVTWGAMVSTDFQTGEMQAHATQGIVLQNLTIVTSTNAQQKVILDCLKTYQPVDLTLTGTLDAYPNGTKQRVTVTLVTRQVVLREHMAAQ